MQVQENNIYNWEEFIDYALSNMVYEKNVFVNAMKHVFLNKPYNRRTNCAELTILSLYKLGLLNEKILHSTVAHPLWFVTLLKNLRYPYMYKDLVFLKKNPILLNK